MIGGGASSSLLSRRVARETGWLQASRHNRAGFSKRRLEHFVTAHPRTFYGFQTRLITTATGVQGLPRGRSSCWLNSARHGRCCLRRVAAGDMWGRSEAEYITMRGYRVRCSGTARLAPYFAAARVPSPPRRFRSVSSGRSRARAYARAPLYPGVSRGAIRSWPPAVWRDRTTAGDKQVPEGTTRDLLNPNSRSTYRCGWASPPSTAYGVGGGRVDPAVTSYSRQRLGHRLPGEVTKPLRRSSRLRRPSAWISSVVISSTSSRQCGAARRGDLAGVTARWYSERAASWCNIRAHRTRSMRYPPGEEWGTEDGWKRMLGWFRRNEVS